MNTRSLNIKKRFANGFRAQGSGTAFVNLVAPLGHPLQNYRILGNSYQSGVPSVASPVSISSVGDAYIPEGSSITLYRIPITGLDTTNVDIEEPLRRIGSVTDELNYKAQKITRRIKSVHLASGTHTFSDASENSYFLCSVIPGAMLNGKSITIPSGVSDCEVLYQLATAETEQCNLSEVSVIGTTSRISISTSILPIIFEIEYRSRKGIGARNTIYYSRDYNSDYKRQAAHIIYYSNNYNNEYKRNS